jgi:hypothetical protein
LLIHKGDTAFKLVDAVVFKMQTTAEETLDRSSYHIYDITPSIQGKVRQLDDNELVFPLIKSNRNLLCSNRNIHGKFIYSF